MFQAFMEKRLRKRIIRRLMAAYAVVSAKNPELSGKVLYAEVLLHARQVEPPEIDKLLVQAESSVDVWTTGAVVGLRFRQVVHFVVLMRLEARGHLGATISIREIVYAHIPADM